MRVLKRTVAGLVVAASGAGLAGCYSYVPDSRPVPEILADSPRHLRVVRTDGSVATLDRPQLEGKALVAYYMSSPIDTIPLGDIDVVQSRQFEQGRTLGLVSAAVALPLAALVIFTGDSSEPLE